MQIYFLDPNNQNWIGLKIGAATILYDFLKMRRSLGILLLIFYENIANNFDPNVALSCGPLRSNLF